MMILDSASVRIAFKPAADLDADFALVGRDDQDDAIVQLLGADAPMAAELIAEILDGVALQRRQRDDHDLVGALVLERLEVGGDRHLLGIGEETASSTTRPVSSGNFGSAASGREP